VVLAIVAIVLWRVQFLFVLVCHSDAAPLSASAYISDKLILISLKATAALACALVVGQSIGLLGEI
jgi:hypothetical protein